MPKKISAKHGAPNRYYFIRHPNGTYYQGRSGIGPRFTGPDGRVTPMFGGTKEQAMSFDTERQAEQWIAKDWRFEGCTVESWEVE